MTRLFAPALPALALLAALAPATAHASGVPDPGMVASIAAQAGNANGLVQFFQSLFSGLQLVGVAIGVLMAGWAGVKIATGQRDGMEKLVYAGIGVFVLLMAKPIIDLVQAATK